MIRMIRKRVDTEQGDLRVFTNATERASIRADSAICNCSSQLQCARLSRAATVRSAIKAWLWPTWIAVDDVTCRLQEVWPRPPCALAAPMA